MAMSTDPAWDQIDREKTQAKLDQALILLDLEKEIVRAMPVNDIRTTTLVQHDRIDALEKIVASLKEDLS